MLTMWQALSHRGELRFFARDYLVFGIMEYMEQVITKEAFDELMKLQGEVWGMGIKSSLNFLLKKEGEKRLRKLEQTVTNLGYPIKYENIKTRDFYPLGLDATILVVAERLFKYTHKDFYELGKSGVRYPSVIRTFMKYFVSFDRVIREVPKIWNQHFTVGDLKVAEYNKEKKYIVLRLEDFPLHPLHCPVFCGLFAGAIPMAFGGEGSCEETKCIHRGDEYHEFLVKW